MKKEAKKQGFTIIEVVLVLAIAGLIFLMVFVALPALQRSQRDTQRRDDMARLATVLTQYQSNNAGNLPAAGAVTNMTTLNRTGNPQGPQKLLNDYLNPSTETTNGFVDPDGTVYNLTITNNTSADTITRPNGFDHRIYINTRTHCDGENAAYAQSDNARDYTIVYKLESTGAYCSDNK